MIKLNEARAPFEHPARELVEHLDGVQGHEARGLLRRRLRVRPELHDERAEITDDRVVVVVTDLAPDQSEGVTRGQLLHDPGAGDPLDDEVRSPVGKRVVRRDPPDADLGPWTALVPPTNTTPQAQGKTVRAMRDPTGELRSTLELGAPDGTAAVLLVNRSGEIVRKIPRTASMRSITEGAMT
jgi:hypothetical protein